MFYKYQSPVLQMFGQYFSFFGLPFYNVTLKNTNCIFLCIFNILQLLLLCYSCTFLDPFEIRSSENRCTLIRKPLFLFFTQFSVVLLFPFISVAGSFSTVYHGRQIMALLDSPCFSEFFCKNRKQSRLIFFLLVVANHISFISVLNYKLSFPVTSLLVRIMELLSLYMICNIGLVSCNVQHYISYATICILSDIERKLIISNMMNHSTIVLKIRNMAEIHYKVNNRMSFINVIYLLLYIFVYILTITNGFICHFSLDLFIRSLVPFAYIAYLANSNRKILTAVNRISMHLKKKPIEKASINTFKNQSELIELYSQHFHMKAFRLFDFNTHFLLQLFVLATSYVVFFSQTN